MALGPLRHVAPQLVVPPHRIRSFRLLGELYRSMERSGWRGRPLLVLPRDGRLRAWTGTHRQGAALLLGLPIPVRVMNQADFGPPWRFTADRIYFNGRQVTDHKILLKLLLATGHGAEADLLVKDVLRKAPRRRA